MDSRDSLPGISLLWIPLGAGGHFVRLNGRVYEFFQALREHRMRLDLYHSALEVRVPAGRFVVEDAWPIPDAQGAARGVVVEGPVFSKRFARLRALRYEVRRWRDGTIFDAAWAPLGPQRISDDPGQAQRLLDLVPAVPPYTWGRVVDGTGEMWNSNSVVSWLLTRTGLAMDAIHPPPGGRAPGWRAGIALAQRAKEAGGTR